MIDAIELAEYRDVKRRKALNAAGAKRSRERRLAAYQARARDAYWANPEQHRARARSEDKHVKSLLERARRHADPRANLLRAAKERAKKHGIEFALTVNDIAVPDYCPALGMRLRCGEGRQNDASPSLDRIDSSKGYVVGNVWVISLLANRIKTNATTEQLRRVADAVDEHVRKAQ